MAEKFEFHGFSVIFCAADGIAAYIDEDVNVIELFRELMTYAPIDITFSAGGGATLRESYIALISAKSSGKNCIHLYKDLN